MSGAIRLAVFTTHPIQYQVPVWRRLTSGGVVAPVVHYFSDTSITGVPDPDFRVPLQWDVPLLDGYESVFVSRHPTVAPGLSLRLNGARELLRSGRFDAVLIAGYVHAFEWQVIAAARRLGLRILMRGEYSDRASLAAGGWRSALRDAVLRRLYRRVDAFCYLGSDARAHLERLGVPSSKLFFSPYSVDSEHFERLAASTSRAASREALGLRDDDFVVLFSGKLIPRKGVDVLAEAVRQLSATKSRIVTLVVGDGPQRPRFEALRAEAGGNRVILAGFVNQSKLGQYFAAADAFALPSRHETWGLVVNEAMYFSLPVIVTDQVGCARDLVGADNGIVVPAADPSSLAAAIARLAADPDAARRMGRAGLARIQGYSIDNTVRGIENAAMAAVRGPQPVG